ncbi:MAG: DEAD/DEAH box helicase [Candidatus Hydrogenedentes bacterium]|nr:DEAD/DEAH box helicase [Candidatus Hydrogenedentota bacterium]
MTFDDFELDPRCLRVLHAQSIVIPTAVQERAIPLALAGRDVIVTAQTGSGKTLAYCLPILTRLARETNRRNRLLVLVPTRELAIQVDAVMRDLAKALHLHAALVYGGVGFGTQISQLKKGADIIVATPGRLLDHMGRGNVRFADLEVLIFDEADRMLDMGFLPDIQRILAKLPVDRQTMMFSATFAPELQVLTSRMMRDPERIEVGIVAKPVETVRQLLIPVRPEEKSRVLLNIFRDEHIDSAIIFLRTKDRTDRLAKFLKKTGYKAAAIHGDLTQQLRVKALEGFRSGKYQILVATDVAARGLDIEDISHVINYDIPLNPDDYIHRIGRTARAAKEGDAWTFVTPTEHQALAGIERAVGRNLPRKEYEGAPPVLSTWHPPGFRPTAPRRSILRRRR